MQPVRGSCLCGAVAFELTGEASRVYHCHCQRCRKVRGTAHATNLAAPIQSVRFLRGEDQLTRYKLPEARFFTHVFCKVCGSSLPNLDAARGIAVVPMGAFDEDPGARAQAHIHVASKAAWDTISDELPQHEAGPPVPVSAKT